MATMIALCGGFSSCLKEEIDDDDRNFKIELTVDGEPVKYIEILPGNSPVFLFTQYNSYIDGLLSVGIDGDNWAYFDMDYIGTFSDMKEGDDFLFYKNVQVGYDNYVWHPGDPWGGQRLPGEIIVKIMDTKNHFITFEIKGLVVEYDHFFPGGNDRKEHTIDGTIKLPYIVEVE